MCGFSRRRNEKFEIYSLLRKSKWSENCIHSYRKKYWITCPQHKSDIIKTRICHKSHAECSNSKGTNFIFCSSEVEETSWFSLLWPIILESLAPKLIVVFDQNSFHISSTLQINKKILLFRVHIYFGELHWRGPLAIPSKASSKRSFV